MEGTMTESDKAILRACLEQTALALMEARQIYAFWDSLGCDVRMRWVDFQADVCAIHFSLKDKAKMSGRG